MSALRHTRLRRSMRRWTLRAGPLTRRSDRVQGIARLLLVLSFLVAPLLAVAASTATAAHLRGTAAAEAAERSRTRAVSLEDAPQPPPSGTYDGAARTTVLVRATWPGPGGTSREGLVRVPPLTPAGTVVPVWVDRHGDPTAAPLDPSGIPGSAAAVAMLPLIGLPAATWTAYALLAFALDARRERRWEREWAAVEPVWHSRLL